MANVAISQAKNLAKNINSIESGRNRKKHYEYKNLGAMATLARNKAVVDFPFMKLKGRIAWVI